MIEASSCIKTDEIIQFQSRRVFNVLAKRLLILLEDLQTDHNINFDKLRNNLSPEVQPIIEQADYFTDIKFGYLRKRILDYLGDGQRELQDELNKYDLTFKK